MLKIFFRCLMIISIGAVAAMVHAKDEVFWIDVRTAEEFSEAHVEAAVNIPYEGIAAGVKQLNIGAGDTVYLYCRSGKRAGIALAELEQAGFTGVINLMTLAEAQALYEKNAAK